MMIASRVTHGYRDGDAPPEAARLLTAYVVVGLALIIAPQFTSCGDPSNDEGVVFGSDDDDDDTTDDDDDVNPNDDDDDNVTSDDDDDDDVTSNDDDVTTPADPDYFPVPSSPSTVSTDCGSVTTSTPAAGTTQTDMRNYNVTALACTRTATKLGCDVGTFHSYSETIQGTLRKMTSNAIANHDVGAFPNTGNPHSIKTQTQNHTVPLEPTGITTGAGNGLRQVFGILTSGVVLEPETAELWNDNTSWRYEALRYTDAPDYFDDNGGNDTSNHPRALGLDCNFAHVQPSGKYHYHGVPTGMLPAEPAMTFIGWAGDGYPIFARYGTTNPDDPDDDVTEMKSSYRVRSGTRPSGSAGPGGAYDGTFVQDWEYVAGLGDLDECNGRTGRVTVRGATRTTYHYFITNTYPYIPRCFRAKPDNSFTGPPAMP